MSPKKENTNDRVSELKKQLADLEDKYKRARADYINLERRAKEERQVLNSFIRKLVIIEILPVFDDLAEAAEHNQGSALIVKKFRQILEKMGVEEIGTKDEVFDPNLHEAVEMVEGEENKVVEIIAC